MENYATGIAGGQHVTGRPLTLADVAGAGKFNLSTIDSRIVKIRPSSTPIDQISRMSGARHVNSMVVQYYSVDTKATETTLSSMFDSEEDVKMNGDEPSMVLHVKDSSIFNVSETVLLPDSIVDSKKGLVGYVTAVGDNEITIKAIGSEGELLADAGDRVVRMGRAASELDVQTSQFQALPQKAENNCQIFKMQVEQSTLQRLVAKEIDWTLSDQEEAAVIDMRLGMEKSFLFGRRAKMFDSSKNEDIYFTGGIWEQCSKEYGFDVANLTNNTLIDICAKAFTNNNGSKNRVLIAGTGLVSAISKIPADRVISIGEPRAKWGIEAREIVSNFGRLYLIHSEVFDQCGHFNDGFIIDTNYLTKYTHIPFNAESLDLRRSGQRNTEAVVVTEASCLVLRYPQSHLKLINTNAAAPSSLS